MKIKNGFVSNSSSSSFVYLLKDFDIDSIVYDWASLEEGLYDFEFKSEASNYLDWYDQPEYKELSETEAKKLLAEDASANDIAALIKRHNKAQKMKVEKYEQMKALKEAEVEKEGHSIKEIKQAILEIINNDHVYEEESSYFNGLRNFIGKMEELGLVKCVAESRNSSSGCGSLHFIRENVIKKFFKGETKNED